MNIATLEHCLKQDFQLEGVLTELYSYQDANYVLHTGDSDSKDPDSGKGCYVVKVMHASADPTDVDMQIHILRTLDECANSNSPITATMVATHNDRDRSYVKDGDVDRIVWIVSYVDGLLAANQQPCTPFMETLTNTTFCLVIRIL